MSQQFLLGAVLGGALTQTDEWQHAFIVGPVVDRYTGEQIATITDADCAEVVKGFDLLGGRMVTPVDLDHGLDTGTTPAQRRTYGRITAMEHREGEGVFVKLALNDGGLAWVADNAGCAFLSPSVYKDLHDPETPGTLLSALWFRSISLTATPRQPGVREIQLSEGQTPGAASVLLASFANSNDVSHFDTALQFHAKAAISLEGYRPAWINVRHWDSTTPADEAGTVVVSWYDEPSDDYHLRQLNWRRDADGYVSVYGPSQPVEIVTTYQVIQPGPWSGVPLSEALEVPMPDPNPSAVLLGEIADAGLRQRIEAHLSEVTSLLKSADESLGKVTKERDELREKLATANTKAEGLEEANNSLATRLSEVERKQREREEGEQKAAEDVFIEALLSEGRIPAGDVEGAKGPDFWRGQFKVDAGNARLLGEMLPAGRFGPPTRPAGISGRGKDADQRERDEDERNDRIKLLAEQIQAEAREKSAPIGFQVAWNLAEKRYEEGA